MRRRRASPSAAHARGESRKSKSAHRQPLPPLPAALFSLWRSLAAARTPLASRTRIPQAWHASLPVPAGRRWDGTGRHSRRAATKTGSARSSPTISLLQRLARQGGARARLSPLLARPPHTTNSPGPNGSPQVVAGGDILEPAELDAGGRGRRRGRKTAPAQQGRDRGQRAAVAVRQGGRNGRQGTTPPASGRAGRPVKGWAGLGGCAGNAGRRCGRVHLGRCV